MHICHLYKTLLCAFACIAHPRESCHRDQTKENYQPISNLAFVSKICEKTVAVQFTNHLRKNSLMEPFQSAYRANHSTETALLRVFNDILRSMDQQKVTILVLLDLSAAFDKVDHNILLHRLHTRGPPLVACACKSSVQTIIYCI